MSQSTWFNITTGLKAATMESYSNKSKHQRKKREVQDVMCDIDSFCFSKVAELENGAYTVGKYRHFTLKDKKKERPISVLPYADRCVQNDVKDAIQPLIMRYMTDDMMGGLIGRGVLSKTRRYCVVQQMREAMNDYSLKYYLKGDVSKFYDNIDNVVSMRLIERKVKDERTLAVVRKHIFNQKKLAIGDPFSHLIANMNMAVIIRKAKAKYGKRIRLINFADDFIAFSKKKETLVELRRDMRQWAKEIRLHYKPMYIRKVDNDKGKKKEPIIFCGYDCGRGFIKPTQRTKKRYIKSRHKKLSMGSYNGIMQVADTKHLRELIELKDNRHMEQKIRRPFAGRPMRVETLEGIKHTIVNFQEKTSKQKDCDMYFHVQAIAEGLGLIVYSTGATKICKYLSGKTREDIPMRDMVIEHDWSGYYYKGTVYTDAEEEAILKEQYNIQY